MGMTGTKYFVIMLVTVSMLAVILLNQLVSASIAMPLKKLNNSVKEWETGNMNPSIYIGGSMEVEHLGVYTPFHGGTDQAADAGYCGRAGRKKKK